MPAPIPYVPLSMRLALVMGAGVVIWLGLFAGPPPGDHPVAEPKLAEVECLGGDPLVDRALCGIRQRHLKGQGGDGSNSLRPPPLEGLPSQAKDGLGAFSFAGSVGRGAAGGESAGARGERAPSGSSDAIDGGRGT